MIVEVDGVFYNNVISITEVANNKATLVMSSASSDASRDAAANKSITVPIFRPIQICGGADGSETVNRITEGKKNEIPVFNRIKDWLKAWKLFIKGIFFKRQSQSQNS